MCFNTFCVEIKSFLQDLGLFVVDCNFVTAKQGDFSEIHQKHAIAFQEIAFE